MLPDPSSLTSFAFDKCVEAIKCLCSWNSGGITATTEKAEVTQQLSQDWEEDLDDRLIYRLTVFSAVPVLGERRRREEGLSGSRAGPGEGRVGAKMGKDPCLGQSPAESSQLHPGCRHP